MHHLSAAPGLWALAGLGLWFLGCLFFAAAGITRYTAVRRQNRTPKDT